MSKNKTIEVPTSEHNNMAFKSFAQRFEVDGEPVECHLREPGKDPAIQIKGKWYVVKFKDIAAALLGHLTEESR